MEDRLLLNKAFAIELIWRDRGEKAQHTNYFLRSLFGHGGEFVGLECFHCFPASVILCAEGTLVLPAV